LSGRWRLLPAGFTASSWRVSRSISALVLITSGYWSLNLVFRFTSWTFSSSRRLWSLLNSRFGDVMASWEDRYFSFSVRILSCSTRFSLFFSAEAMNCMFTLANSGNRIMLRSLKEDILAWTERSSVLTLFISSSRNWVVSSDFLVRSLRFSSRNREARALVVARTLAGLWPS